MKKIFGVLLIVTTLVLEGCSGVTFDKVNNTNKIQVFEDNHVLGGRYVVDFEEAEVVQSAGESVPLLKVNYVFTNKASEAISADAALMLIAYQDNVEVEQVFDETLTGENSSKNIKSGASINCAALFKIESTSDMEVEAEEFLGIKHEKVIKSYAVGR